jgi:UDP-2,3-diacylglucosamine pyrophosphatase LpxH
MKALISNDWHKHISKSKREKLECAFEFAAKELGLSEKDIKVYIVLCDKIEPEDQDKNLLVFGDYTNYPYKNYGRIRISTRYCRSFLFFLTLFHEMVHAKQHTNRELIAYKDGIVWNGRKVKENLEYKKLPYEIEARKLEKKLFLKWIAYRFIKWLN